MGPLKQAPSQYCSSSYYPKTSTEPPVNLSDTAVNQDPYMTNEMYCSYYVLYHSEAASWTVLGWPLEGELRLEDDSLCHGAVSPAGGICASGNQGMEVKWESAHTCN